MNTSQQVGLIVLKPHFIQNFLIKLPTFVPLRALSTHLALLWWLRVFLAIVVTTKPQFLLMHKKNDHKTIASRGNINEG